MILKSVDTIMDEEKRDMFFIDFGAFYNEGFAPERARHREEHFAWFRFQGLRYVPAAPRGWLEGNPGLFAVFFSGPADKRVEDYTSRFENLDGSSLEPDYYQMRLVTYQSWLDRGGPGHLTEMDNTE
jgi:hypothetical protein